MKEKSISFHNTPLTWFEAGAGMPLVFIHGFCEDHMAWNEFIQPFVKNYHVLLVDLPGFGKSDLPEEKISIGYYAEAVKAILDAENISLCAMIGHSMGGYAVLNFASRFDDYLKGFTLFHSSAFEDDEAKKQDRTRVARFVWENGAAPFVNELYNKLFAEKYFSTHEKEIEALKKYATSASSVEGIAGASLAMRDRTDTTGVLKNTTVPVLFIIGKEDKVVPPEKALQLVSLPNTSALCLLDAVGHMGMFEATDECLRVIEEWISLLSTEP